LRNPRRPAPRPSGGGRGREMARTDTVPARMEADPENILPHALQRRNLYVPNRNSYGLNVPSVGVNRLALIEIMSANALFSSVRFRQLESMHDEPAPDHPICGSPIILLHWAKRIAAPQAVVASRERTHSRRPVRRRDENGSYASYGEAGVCDNYC